MSLKLVTYPALFRSQKVIIAAEMAKVNLEIDDKATESQLASLSVHGKVPCLVTPEGNISESNAIARYIARMAPASLGLLGATPFESAQVDSWLDFCVQDLEIPATLWIAPILGWMDNNEAVSERAAQDLKKGMHVIENHLKMETFIVGRQMTLADIAIATTLLLPLKLVLDAKAREAFPNLMRWFDLCIHQTAFVDVVGETKLCEVPLKPAAPAKAKEEKPKEEKKKEEKPKAAEKPKEEKPKAEKRKQDEEEMAEETFEDKKAKNPLEDLPKSAFVLDAWKREYSNAPGGDCYQAMPYFWQNYDKEGYSLWFCDYNFNAECKVAFMTSNLVSGFIQRSDSLRKYAFGVMQIIGTPTSQKVLGAWLIRGQDIGPMLAENDDAEYYTWTKLTQPPTEEQKKRLELLWCEEKEIDGQSILDGKVFK